MKLRGTKSDSSTWTHTMAQTAATHVFTCWSGDFPTTSDFMVLERRIDITEVIAKENRRCTFAVNTVPPRGGTQIGRHPETCCRGARGQRETCPVHASHR